MSKFDDLRATTEKDDDTVVSIHVPRQNKAEQKTKSPTLISILLNALKAENFKANLSREKTSYHVPVPKYTLIGFGLLFIVTILILAVERFMDLKIVIPLTLLLAVLAIPSLVIVFFIEFNTRRSITPLHIIFMMLLGVFSYAFVTTICDKFLVTFIYESYIDTIGRPLAWTFLLCLIVFISCNIMRVTKLPEIMLISVSFALGYVIANSFLTGFDSLFINTKITIEGTQGAYYNVGVVIDDIEGLTQSLNQLNAHWFETFIYTPVHLSSLSVIVASVVSYKERAKAEKKQMIKSLYLLLMLDIILYSISVVQTNFIIFDSILKTVAIVLSMSLSIKIIDYSLEKESRDNVS